MADQVNKQSTDQANKQSSDQANKQSSNATQKYSITVDGVVEEVTLDELKNYAQKGKDYIKKTQTLSEREKSLKASEDRYKAWKPIMDDVDGNRSLAETLNKTYQDFKSGKISKSEGTDRSLKTLDRKIEDAKSKGDLESLESLKEVREIISEEGVGALKDEVTKLKEEIAILRNSTLVSIEERTERDLNVLRDEFGKDLVDKYADQVRQGVSKYPGQSAARLFRYFAGDDPALDKAFLTRAEKKKQKEIENKTNASSAGVKTTFTKTEPVKDKYGRVDWHKTVENMKAAGKFNIFR